MEALFGAASMGFGTRTRIALTLCAISAISIMKVLLLPAPTTIVLEERRGEDKIKTSIRINDIILICKHLMMLNALVKITSNNN